MDELLVRLLADATVVTVFLLAMYAFLFVIPRKHWWYWAWRIVLAGVTAYLTAKLIGHFYQPESLRPFEKLGLEPGAAYLPNPGFPSDHALFAAFLTIAVWMSTRSRAIAGTMLVLMVVMCVARVLALVHTPLDVVGGVVIACVGVVWYRHTADKVVKYPKS